MLYVAKTSLISRWMGFVRDGEALGGWKKKGFSAPPPTSPYIKQKDLIRRGSSQRPSFKSLATPPPPPLPPDRLGNVFAFPIPWLVSDFTHFKLNVHYLFTYAVTLVAQLYGMFPEYPTLFYTEGLLFRIPRLFLIGSDLWYPIYFSPHNGGHQALVHVPSYPEAALSCVNITLTMASIIPISQGRDKKGRFLKFLPNFRRIFLLLTYFKTRSID